MEIAVAEAGSLARHGVGFPTLVRSMGQTVFSIALVLLRAYKKKKERPAGEDWSWRSEWLTQDR